MAQNNSSPEAQERRFITETTRGAMFHTIHVERTVRIYPVEESELEMLSTFNALATVFFSVGAGLASYAAALLTNAIIQGDLTETGKALVCVVTPLCAVLAVLCFGIAIWALRSRRSQLARIREESYIG